jgi:predicted nucleic-acid-binding protein
MTTIGIDTNTLLTLRLKREPDFTKVKTLFEKCIEGKIKIYVPLPVILENEWVLRSFYKQPKEKIIQFLNELLLIDMVVVDSKDEIKVALNLYKNENGVNFTDCVILQLIKSKNYEFLTFDRSLERLYYSL